MVTACDCSSFFVQLRELALEMIDRAEEGVHCLSVKWPKVYVTHLGHSLLAKGILWCDANVVLKQHASYAPLHVLERGLDRLSRTKELSAITQLGVRYVRLVEVPLTEKLAEPMR